MIEPQHAYKQYLGDHNGVSSYEQSVTSVEWQDGFTGEKHVHVVDFTINWANGTVENVDVVPPSQQRPLTKYLYAQNQIKNWRMITEEEWTAMGMVREQRALKW